MDGFEVNEGVIILVVINCKDVLDLVLLCSGCFDWNVIVGNFDIKGCEKIFGVYVCKMFLGLDVDLCIIVCGMSGFFGVDFVNFVNEVVLMVVCVGCCFVIMEDFEFVKDKVMMGVECCLMVLM